MDRQLISAIAHRDHPVAGPAFGGLAETMEAISAHVRPGGLALVGDGFWARPPRSELVGAIGEFPDLSGTIAAAESGGWLTGHGHVSDQAEWDEYDALLDRDAGPLGRRQSRAGRRPDPRPVREDCRGRTPGRWEASAGREAEVPPR
ncbi:MAG TPA: hypothetical protein VFV66_34160 [Nonomuraea sp.]|nr:hypothetical protein [Nonomuraea sp.]